MLDEHLEKEPQYCVFNIDTEELESYETEQQAVSRRNILYHEYKALDTGNDGEDEGKLGYRDFCDMFPIQKREI